MLTDANATSQQEAYFIYYNRNELQAVVMGDWKLYFPHKYRSIAPGQAFRNDGIPIDYFMIEMKAMELYHIPTDPSESKNVFDQNPEIVLKMNALAEKARADMGDALQNRQGKNTREPGNVN